MREPVYRALAREDRAEIYLRRAEREGVASAQELVSAIQDRCEGLTRFSERGTPRPQIGPGVRSIPFRRKAVIAYVVRPGKVVIIGILYGGRALTALKEPGRLLSPVLAPPTPAHNLVASTLVRLLGDAFELRAVLLHVHELAGVPAVGVTIAFNILVGLRVLDLSAIVHRSFAMTFPGVLGHDNLLVPIEHRTNDWLARSR